jgi:HK97 family phage portal protein
MGWFSDNVVSRLRAARRAADRNSPETQRVAFSGRTQAGVYINADNAITIPAAWACIRYLSQTVAVLPWRVMRDAGAGGEVWKSHPIDWLLWQRPSAEWSSFQFRETLTHWALRRGNGYAEIERDTLGRPIALWPIHPDRVDVRRDPETLELYYRVSNGAGGSVDFDPADIFHVRGFGEGPVGVNVMAYAAESLGWAKAAQLFGAGFFGRGANPTTVVTMKKQLSPEGLAELKKKFRELYSGPRADRTAFLDNEMDLKTVTVAPNAAQFIETNQHLVVEVCRWFGVPPHKVMHLLQATFSNIEHQSIEVVVDSVSPWSKRFEDEANFKLFGPVNRGGAYTKMNLNALMRGDAASRASFYNTMRQMGALSVNDIRRLEDMPTVGPEGDVLVMQAQFVPLEQILNPPEPEQTEPIKLLEAPDDEEPEQAEARSRLLAALDDEESPTNVH